MSILKLIGPFNQLLTMDKLPIKGALADNDLEVIDWAGILVENGLIKKVGLFENLYKEFGNTDIIVEEQRCGLVVLPGFVDPHTHICWAGSRAMDYSMRLNGKSYLEIAAMNGGIWSTVSKTRQASLDELTKITLEHAHSLLKDGVTTIEVKSGYGLNIQSELKMLEAINKARDITPADLVVTCLAAHICPKDFNGTQEQYLQYIISELFPVIRQRRLSNRIDIYIDKSAFTAQQALPYLKEAKSKGFDITVHADQFTTGGSDIAVEVNALSADHLEFSGNREIENLAKHKIVPVALPASSIGLGNPFTPARKLLNCGASLAIGSDWNPGSAPMGDLLTSAAILGIYEKLNNAETFAAITFRAAAALGLYDRGIVKEGQIADFIAFETEHFNEILYHQGRLKPSLIWKNGNILP